MLENIELKKFPKESGVYWIADENDVVVYVGSSSNLYHRMRQHRSYIKAGEHSKGSQKDFYEYLQKNEFKINFELANDYRQKEQGLINYYNPIFNQKAAYGFDKKAYEKAYYETHKEERNQYKKRYNKRYNNQKCLYNGETLTLNALAARFQRQGIPHSILEAKKYLAN